jgi:hypothetical protein
VLIAMLGPVGAGTYSVSPNPMPAQASFQATDDVCVLLFAITPFAQAGSTLIIRSIFL